MKKRLSLVLLLVLLALLLAIVGWRFFLAYQPIKPLSDDPQPPVSDPVLRLRLGHNMTPDSALHAAAERFAAAVAQRSAGEVQVRIFPDQELGNDHLMLELARRGELDMLLTPSAKLGVAVPAMQYADLPFFFDSRTELYQMLDGPPGDALLAQLERIGLVGVTFWENGFKHFTANQPLRTPDDFDGLRFRIMKSPMLAAQFEALGAIPVPIDFHATRQALAEGAVDGQENPLVAIVAMQFDEVQSHLTLSGHGFLGYVFSISRQVFAGLTPQVRELLVDTAREISHWQRTETQRREEGLLADIQAAGVEVHTLDARQRAQFAQRLALIPRQFETTIGTDLLAMTETLRWQALPPQERAQTWVIGLDADLSAAGAMAGMAIRRGIDLALAEINAQGGLLGRPVQLVALDHRGLPALGTKHVQALAAIPELLAVIGGMHSAVTKAELDTIADTGLPYLIPWAAASDLTQIAPASQSIFRYSISDAMAMPFLLDQVHSDPRHHPGLLLEQSAWGRSNAAAARVWQEHNDAPPLEMQWFPRGEQLFGPYLERFAAQGVNTLMMVANPKESVLILEAMAARTKPWPIDAHWGLTGGPFWQHTQDLLKQVDLRFLQTAIVSPCGQPELCTLIDSYRRRYGLEEDEPMPAPLGTLHAYELVRILATAVAAAGSGEHAAVNQALEQIQDYQGLLRHYPRLFSPEQHEAMSREDLRLARFNDQGQIVAAP